MLEIDIHSFAYDQEEVLKDVRLHLKPGEHLAVLGESGCGKSTLLHLVYGLLDLEKGTAFWNGERLLGPKHNLIPGEHFMKLVSQEFNIMPFTSVSDNIATHLSRLDAQRDASRVRELLQIVDLEAFANTKVKNLSGGQKQRVAIAKALAKEPELLLLDEPFSSIDTFRKNRLSRNLYGHLKSKGISCITATHDSHEALAFSDKIMILKDGAVVQFGSPKEVYSELSTPYQAGFFGEVNVIPGGIFSSESLVLLPHQLVISEEETRLQVTVKQCYFKGSHYLIRCEFEDVELFFNHKSNIHEGELVFLEQEA
ncbi:MAG: ABC transporter ATP-binding protein [Bacteroidota bacterium]